MATKVIRIDDLDGTEDETVEEREFEIGGVTYAVDLSPQNAGMVDDLVERLDAVIAVARVVKKTKSSKKASDGPAIIDGYSNSDVRTWAQEKGIEVSARGKLADDVIEKFNEAHRGSSQ
jgi:hypothetical protein